MARTDREAPPEGVEFLREDDGTVTARDLKTGLARGGDTRAEALMHLAEVLALESGVGEPIENPDSFLRDHGISIEEVDEDPPEFL